MKNLNIASAISLALAAGSAMAQTPSFEELDQNGNGYIDSTEAQAFPCLAANFDRIDTESSEGLNQQEFDTAIDEYCQQEQTERDWPQRR